MWTSEPMETLIPNTTMVKRYRNGTFLVYYITPNEGYVLHDNALDVYEDFDELGNPIGEPIAIGLTGGMCSVGASYDFDVNSRGFYAIPSNQLPADGYISGIDEPEHEVM